jgi:hypothetical protein
VRERRLTPSPVWSFPEALGSWSPRVELASQVKALSQRV